MSGLPRPQFNAPQWRTYRAKIFLRLLFQVTCLERAAYGCFVMLRKRSGRLLWGAFSAGKAHVHSLSRGAASSIVLRSVDDTPQSDVGAGQNNNDIFTRINSDLAGNQGCHRAGSCRLCQQFFRVDDVERCRDGLFEGNRGLREDVTRDVVELPGSAALSNLDEHGPSRLPGRQNAI